MRTDDLFDKNKFVCLINNMLIEENTSFSQVLNTTDFEEFNAVLMENLVR